jgi:hypothetical protein
MTIKRNLSTKIDILSRDIRLSRVITGNNPCVLQLWVLIIDKKETRIFYGWIMPSLCLPANKWSECEINLKNVSSKYELYRLSFYNTGAIILKVITDLCEGMTLKEVCEKNNLQIDSSALSNLKLTTPQEGFAVRPVIIAGSKDSLPLDILKTMRSPYSETSAFIGSLVNLNKMILWQNIPEEVAKIVVVAMSEQTGFAFAKSDSKRFGNIEWINIPVMNSQVDFITLKKFRSKHDGSVIKDGADVSMAGISCQGVEVCIKRGSLEKGAKLLVRCQLRNYGDIVSDSCRMIQIDDDPCKIDFSAQEEIDYVLLTIWKNDHGSDRWSIWYENSCFLLRGINLGIGMIGVECRLHTGAFDKFKGSKADQKVKELERVQQVHFNYSAIAMEGFDPWGAAGSQSKMYVQHLFPTISGGGFFAKGWEGDEPGLLSFVSWLKSLSETNAGNIKEIQIIDPYFDALGIDLLLARAKETNINYSVLTNTQINSSGKKNKKRKEPLRATRIRESCKKLGLVLSQLNIKILDLRSIKGGDKQLFHDRYILLYDYSGYIAKGYHLSNSIQGATRSHPLLVTPIPQDIIEKVAQYVKKLLVAQPPIVNEARVIQIYPAIKPKNNETIKESSSTERFPYLRRFAAACLGSKLIWFLPQKVIYARLKRNGIITNLHVFKGDISSIKTRLGANLIPECLKNNAKEFKELWIAFCHWLAHTPTTEVDDYLNIVAELGKDGLAAKVESMMQDYIASTPKTIKAKISITELDVLHNLCRGYGDNLIGVEYLLGHGLFVNDPSKYPTMYGARTLLKINPQRLMRCMEAIMNRAEIKMAAIDPNDSKIIELSHINGVIISEIVNNFHFSRHKMEDFINCKVPFIRALATQSYLLKYDEEKKAESLIEAIPLLNGLNNFEIVLTLSAWVYHLRVQANRNNNSENNELMNLRQMLFGKIREVYNPQEIPVSLLSQSVVKYLGGPSEGDWALSTTNDLLIPLMNGGKISHKDIADIWLNMLLKYLKNDSYFNSSVRELNDVSAWCLVGLDSSQRTTFTQEIDKIFLTEKRIIQRTCSRSVDFDSWNKARIRLIWLHIIIKLSLHYYLQLNNDQVFEEYLRNDDSELNALADELFIADADSIQEEFNLTMRALDNISLTNT